MAILKGLIDSRSRVFSGTTNAESITPVTETESNFTATAGLVNPIIDGEADSIESIVSSTRGRAILHEGETTFTLDLRNEFDTTDIEVVYNRTVDSTPELVTAVVSVNTPYYVRGFAEGLFYRPEVHGTTDDLVIEPGRTTRVVCIKPIADGGHTAETIASLEGLEPSAITGTWLRNNTAAGGDGRYYGEGDDLALSLELGTTLFTRWRKDFGDFQSPWCLLKRGSNFTGESINTPTLNDFGESALHPILVGAYGTGDKPYLPDTIFNVRFCANIVVSHLHSEIKTNFSNYTLNCGYDDMVIDLTNANNTQNESASGLSVEGNTQVGRHYFIRRAKVLHNYQKTIPGGSTWGTGQRASAFHTGSAGHGIYEKLYSDQAGAAWAYRADRSVVEPKAPENQSHFFYQANGNWDTTFVEMLSMWGSGSIMQLRSGGTLVDVVGFGYNTGINPGRGFWDVDDFFGLYPLVYGEFSMIHRYWQGEAGFKDTYVSPNAVIAGGVDINTDRLSSIESGSINSSTYRLYTDPTDIGPGTLFNPPGTNKWFPIKPNTGPDLLGNPIGFLDSTGVFCVSNHNRSQFPDGVFTIEGLQSGTLPSGTAAQATRDLETPGYYLSSLIGGSGYTLKDLSDYLTTLDTPWEHAKLISTRYAALFGYSTPTPTPSETMIFQPNTTWFTPGYHGHLKIDWRGNSSGGNYLPGDTTNNSINLQGHDITWNFSPKNTLNNLTFGEGGKITLNGGKIPLTGVVTCDAAGNSINSTRCGGGKITLSNTPSGGVLSCDLLDSRLLINGDITNNLNITARYGTEVVIWEGSDFTVASGKTLTVYGNSYVGFDGLSGSSSTLTLNGTLSFKPTIRTEVDGMVNVRVEVDFSPGVSSNAHTDDFYWPAIGSVVDNDTSGATATARFWCQNTNTSAFMVFDDIVGSFSDDDAISGDDCQHGIMPIGERDIGDINGTPIIFYPTIGEVRTGLNGFNSNFIPIEPNVVSNVVLGGTLNVDVNGLADDTYTLINVDDVDGSFASVTAENNTGRTIIINANATSVTMVLGTGSTSITNNT